MRKRLALILCALTGIGCAKPREFKGIGRIQAPASLDSPFTHRANADYAVLGVERWFWSFFPGGVRRQRAMLVMAVAAPDRSMEVIRDQARGLARSRCEKIDANGVCIAYDGSDYLPAWIVTAEDPANRVSMAYFAFQKDVRTREEAQATLDAVIKSFHPVADPATYFAEIRERPLRDAKAGEKREQQMLAWFKKHNWPMPRLEENVQHGDCAYFWTHRNGSELIYACRFGSRPGSKPLETGYQERNGFPVATYEFVNGEWMLRKPGQVLDITLQPWPPFANDTYDPGRVYYFLFGTAAILYEDVADSAQLPDDLLGELIATKAEWRD